MTGKIKRVIKRIGGRKAFSILAGVKSFMQDLLWGKAMLKKRVAFYSTFIKENDLCFDVGANVGNRVSVFLTMNAKVVAVEPQPNCIKILKEKFGDKILVIPKGVGAAEEERQFFISSNSTLSTFDANWIDVVKESRFEGNSWDEVQKMQVTTLDNIIKDQGTPHFIKIDVEGFELEVLKGLNKPVNFISIEYAVPERLEHTRLCLEKLKMLSPTATCNYSIGESMKWALEKWIAIDEMLDHISTRSFIETDFGDIYISKS